MNRRTIEKVITTNQFYSTRSAVEHPAMCCPTLEGAIEQAKRKLSNNGEDEIYIVKIVRLVRRYKPQPEFEVVEVK